MEITTETLGGRIAAFRKAKGWTQEQLADRVGVSAPAVSKWETGSSCPDIALLCPLARALDTNVDTLLQFEQTLSDREVTDRLNAILKPALQDGTAAARDTAQQQLEDLLHQYPNCTALQYNTAVAYDSLQMFFPATEKSVRQSWRERKRFLLEQVRAAGSAAYWQSATINLAAMEIADGDPDRGAALLKELPERPGDPSSVWALYHLKKGEPEEALKLTQKQLYGSVSRVLSGLLSMANLKLLPDPQRRRKALDAYRAVATVFELPDMSDGLLLEWYLEQNDTENAARCFVRSVDILLSPVTLPDPALFAPGLSVQQPPRPPAGQEMRRLLLQELSESDRFRPLWEFPDCRAALERLRRSCDERQT